MAERAFAVLGLFRTPDDLMEAIGDLRGKELGKLEAYTPYPIHGIEKALGLRKSPVPGMVLVMGILGASFALLMEWWMLAVDYPIVTGGKALFSWQAFVPIMFELTVLFACFTSGLGMLFLLNRLPFFGHPVLSSRAISSITCDRFALAIEVPAQLTPILAGGRARFENRLDVDAAREALLLAGAEEVEVLPFPERVLPVTSRALVRYAAAITVACAVGGYATYWGVKLFPVLPPMKHMLDQPRLS